MLLPPCTEKNVECPIDDVFVDALKALTSKAGTEVWKKLRSALVKAKKLKTKKLENMFLSNSNFRDVALATQFRAYALFLAELGHTYGQHKGRRVWSVKVRRLHPSDHDDTTIIIADIIIMEPRNTLHF